ncbi:AraC family transcriptional regulator [Vibrio diazotrophicus]|jgi:AraC-like DNA-binding protein|nr:AraC family transcriptional regulator [Vibrio diazotrophicus]
MIFSDSISAFLEKQSASRKIWFAGDFHTPPVFSYQVNFPRLELVLSGTYINEMESHDRTLAQICAKAGDAIYIPPNCWNKPNWNTDCSVLSMLFGKRQLGLSLVSKRKEEEGFYEVQKHSIPTRSGFAIDNILEALNSIARESIQKPMDDLLLQALLQYSNTMLDSPSKPMQNRATDIYQSVCIYVQENFHRPISRNGIADRFNLSPNHLSRLFKQQGHMTLADYITWVRIDRAKFMIKKYDFKLNDVAIRCGFKDVNYFCRVFKTKTGITPTEYRSTL